MTDPNNQLLRQLEEHEAGVSDLIAAYELAERQYFAAVHASAPYVEQTIASNSTSRVADADLG
ncbi:MAG: hypothetical protein OXG41_00735 [Acidimicrobiaceae bacterium]|nr:hypothetical protein [Acidimicrobiaceae bacterium]